MVKEKVTKEDLMGFAVGDEKTFTLPNWDKAKSAASYAYQAKNRQETYGWMFKAVIGDPVEGSMQRDITITRLV